MSVFHFKYFSVEQQHSSMKVGTDAMLLGSLASNDQPLNILDIGCGTGVLSLMMAQKYPQASITGIELDQEAIIDCQRNFQESDWTDRLKCVHGDFLEFNSANSYDLILSNPPFFENSLKNSTEKKSRARHSDSLPVEKLVGKVTDLLSENGSFWLILPIDIAQKSIYIAEENGLYPRCLYEIEGKPGNKIRMVLEFLPYKPEKVLHSCLCIRDVSGKYTNEYKQLTIDFHNKLLD